MEASRRAGEEDEDEDDEGALLKPLNFNAHGDGDGDGGVGVTQSEMVIGVLGMLSECTLLHMWSDLLVLELHQIWSVAAWRHLGAQIIALLPRAWHW